MAKIYGLFGAMTGKTADVVMSVRNGVQLIRKYQPIVANPNTIGQVQARAKLKLLSQLSAVMARGLAIPKKGLVSSRNAFTRLNYGNLSYANNKASVAMASLDITGSPVAFPTIEVSERTETSFQVGLTRSSVGYDSVVYMFIAEDANGKYSFFDSKVVSEPGTTNRYAVTENVNPSVKLHVYAYGVTVSDTAYRTTYGSLLAEGANAVLEDVRSQAGTKYDITGNQYVLLTNYSSRDGGDPETKAKKK